MITEIKVGPEQFEKTNRFWARHYMRSYWRGLLPREHSEFMDNYRRFTANKQRGPLTPEQVLLITKDQAYVDANYADRSKELDVSRDITPENVPTLSSRQKFAFILQQYVESDSRRISRAANIGARVDFYSAYLASRFPNIEFMSVGFQPRLALHNSLLPQSPNWRFLTGYWLDLMRSGVLRADLYFSVSTTVLMNNRQLNTYLDELAKHATALAFCEGWWPRANTLVQRIIRPEEVPKERPYCSGAYANYHHNYIKKLQERGFEIKLSQIVPEADNYHYLQILAARPGTARKTGD